MKKIPVLGTQSLNSFTNLKNLINSIDYPVETLSIVINSENVNYFLDVDEFCKNNIDKDLIERVDISFHPTNLGCPASWNYHFKSYPYADFFVKPDDDIVFSPGDLEKIVNALSSHDMVFYSSGTGYACFGITKHTLKTVGLFDENLFPCNYEDNDYELRCNSYEIKKISLSLNTHHVSSGTSRNITAEEHEKYLQKYLITTEEYFHRKWNGEFGNPLQWWYNYNYRENKIFRYKNYY
jgi:GT2 family glycosyltransferase